MAQHVEQGSPEEGDGKVTRTKQAPIEEGRS